MPKWRTIGDIQICFDGNRAAFNCSRKLDLPAVKTELEATCDFIESWLDAAARPKPRGPTPEEIDMENMLSIIMRQLKRLKFDKEHIAGSLRAIVAQAADRRWPGVSAESRERVVQGLISTL